MNRIASNFNLHKTRLHLTSMQLMALSLSLAAQWSVAPCSADSVATATGDTTIVNTANSDNNTDINADIQSGSIKIPYRIPTIAAKKTTLSEPGDSTKNWEQLEAQGEKAAYNCDYGDGERLLKEAVEKARNFPAGDLRLAKSSGELGRLLAIRGRFSEAEPLLEEELAVKTVASEAKDEHLIPAMSSMVRFYLLHGTATKANPLAKKILSFVEGKLNEARTLAQGKVTLQAGQPLQAWVGEASAVMRDPLIELTLKHAGHEGKSLLA